MKTISNQNLLGVLFLIITATGWGLNWPGMKLLLQEWPPLFARGVAGVAAAMMLGALSIARGERLHISRQTIKPLVLVAFTNVFAWMGFSSLALSRLTVSEGALLVYTMPVWAALFEWPILGKRPTIRSIVALGLGIAGISILLTRNGLNLGFDKWIGVLFALGAAIPFAFGTVLKRTAIPLPPIVTTAWQVGMGCVPMVLIGIFYEKPNYYGLTATGWSVMIYMTFVSMGACYLAWAAALKRLTPAAASTAMLLVPLIGTLSGAWILGETFALREAIALLLTLGGVMLALLKH